MGHDALSSKGTYEVMLLFMHDRKKIAVSYYSGVLYLLVQYKTAVATLKTFLPFY